MVVFFFSILNSTKVCGNFELLFIFYTEFWISKGKPQKKYFLSDQRNFFPYIKKSYFFLSDTPV